MEGMTQTANAASPLASVEEIQQGWHTLTLRVAQLEAEKSALEHENKALRFLLERVIEHRQKSHGELVLLLTALISKLPINDVGVIVSKLVEHNTHVNQVLAALVKGTADADLPQPMVLKAMEQTKRELVAALKPTVEELIRLETPLERDMLLSLPGRPELFFSPKVARANRCWVKGQVPRERILKEFGDAALVFFQDVTTDPKLNPRPKPEEIALAFKPEFEALFQQHEKLLPDKRQELMELFRKVQRSKSHSDQARAQKNAFLKLSFMLELLHFYENQNTEAPDVLFAQRLPALVEQMVITGPRDNLEERLIVEAENLMAFVVNPDHRQMIVNNVGKGGGTGKTLRYVLALRAGKMPAWDELIDEFVKHLLPPRMTKAPPPELLHVGGAAGETRAAAAGGAGRDGIRPAAVRRSRGARARPGRAARPQGCGSAEEDDGKHPGGGRASDGVGQDQAAHRGESGPGGDRRRHPKPVALPLRRR